MKATSKERMLLFTLIALGLSMATYWMVRYGGWANEGDSVRLLLAAQGTAIEGTIEPTFHAYSNGFSYPAILTMLAVLTGLPVEQIQQAGSLWLGIIVFIAFLTYRQLLNHWRATGLAVLFLLIQPDFIFYVLRNSHERITWTLGLLVLWLWARIYSSINISRFHVFAVIILYLLLWAMVTSNVYLASTIVTTYALGMIGLMILERLGTRTTLQNGRQFTGKMWFIPFIGLVMVFLFINYVYQPAANYYHTLNSFFDRLAALFFAGEEIKDPYAYVQSAWRNTPIYLLLTFFQWLIALLAATAWLRDGRELLVYKAQLPSGRLILWFLFLGFVVQLVPAVILDFAGVFSSNLQVRLFTPLALITSAYAATWLQVIEIQRVPRIITAGITICLAITASTAALVKSSADPLAANQWLFYETSEITAAIWIDDNLRNGEVWIDTLPHLRDVLYAQRGYLWRPSNNYRITASNVTPTHVLWSKLTVTQALFSGATLPVISNHHRIYHNGNTEIYQRRPVTQFQK